VELEVVVGVADEHGGALVDLGEGAARDHQRRRAGGRGVRGDGDRGGPEQPEAQAASRFLRTMRAVRVRDAASTSCAR
jgi:hypothetical protein